MRTASPITILAGEDLEANRRVMHNGTSWVYADANDKHHAVTGDTRIPNGRYGAAYLTTDAAVVDIESSSTLTAGSTAYGADDGKVSSTVAGIKAGVVLSAPVAASNPAGILLQPLAESQANFAYPATPVDAVFFTAQRAMRVRAITLRPTVGASGATAVIRKVPSGTAIGSGTALHSGTLDLNGTANTNQSATLSTTSTDLLLAAGDSLAIDVSGTTTNATGVVGVKLEDQ